MSEVLGVLFAVLVSMMMIPKLLTYQQESNNNVRATIVAQQAVLLNNAVSQYVQQNLATIQASATSTIPYTITVANLTAAGLLAPSFNPVNPYGQTWQAQVLQPSSGILQALVYSTGGTAINDLQGRIIQGFVGNSGGLIPLNDSGKYPNGASVAVGTADSWQVSTTHYSAISGGHPASLLTFNSGNLVSNYLYRSAVPGQPQLNTMNTDLNLGTNSITNAANITASGTITAGGGTEILDYKAGEGGYLQLKGANGLSTYLANLNGAMRFLDSGWTKTLFSVDQNANGTLGSLALSSGNSLTIGNSNTAYYGDGTNLALRAPGGVYFQTTNALAPIDIKQVANIYSSGSITTSNGNFKTTNGQVVTYGNTWGNINYGPSNNPQYAVPKSEIGSSNVNDIYLRSIGAWGSQLAGIGVNQSWHDVTSARRFFYGYQNNTGRPMMVNVSIDSTSGGKIYGSMTVGGVVVASYNNWNNRYGTAGNFAAVVPSGSSYQVNLYGANNVVGRWSELY